jgi:hypothetical protein
VRVEGSSAGLELTSRHGLDSGAWLKWWWIEWRLASRTAAQDGQLDFRCGYRIESAKLMTLLLASDPEC